MDNRTCKMCEVNKPPSEYYKNRNTYVPYCKPCFKLRANKKYVKASERPGYTPRKPGRKRIVLTKEQLDIIHSHQGNMRQLAFKLGVTYGSVRHWKQVGKF
jgi:hypothetical protein